MYQALYRKWRPRTFDDVVGQGHITQTLKRQVESDRLSHAYLFTGTRGTGKTSCAKILSRAVNCHQPVNGNPCNACPACLGIESGAILDVLELDAASNNGVDQVRALRDEAVYTPVAVGKRVYIIDEVHMLSTAAFNALLKILEEPPAHLLFILATTELHKVPATIKSRCQQFSFKRILAEDIAQRLQDIAKAEGITLTDDGSAFLARLADGGLRDALSLLDQCVVPQGVVDEESVLQALGYAGNREIADLMDAVADGDSTTVLDTVHRLYSGGKDVGALLRELGGLARDLLVEQMAPQGGSGLLTGGYDGETMRRLSKKLSPQRLAYMVGQVQDTAAGLYLSQNRRTDAELCLLRLCHPQLDDSSAALAARVAQLERGQSPQAVVTRPAPEAPASTPAPVVAPAPTSTPVNVPVPVPEPEVAAVPVSAPVAVAQPDLPVDTGVNTAFWSSFVASLKGKIPPMAYTFLNNPAFAGGSFAQSVLTIWVDSEMVSGAVNKPEVMSVIGQRATEVLGDAVRVTITVGKCPETAPVSHDKMEDLMALRQKFGNFTIET